MSKEISPFSFLSKKLFSFLPNFITISRILILPLVSYLYYKNTPFYTIASGLIFGLFALTDCIDGYLARKFKIESNFGRCMDPISDKIYFIYPLLFFLNTKYFFCIFIFILRELFISEFRILSLIDGKKIHVIGLSKIKTIIQLTGISFVISKNPILFNIGLFVMLFALFFSIQSVFMYIKQNLKLFTKKFSIYIALRICNLFLVLSICTISKSLTYSSIFMILDILNLGLKEYYAMEKKCNQNYIFRIVYNLFLLLGLFFIMQHDISYLHGSFMLLLLTFLISDLTFTIFRFFLK